MIKLILLGTAAWFVGRKVLANRTSGAPALSGSNAAVPA